MQTFGILAPPLYAPWGCVISHVEIRVSLMQTPSASVRLGRAAPSPPRAPATADAAVRP